MTRVWELARSMGMVTGLPVIRSSAPGWIGMQSESEGIVLWLLRRITVKNDSVRQEGDSLY
jgi:hypothetical protein